MVVRESPFRVVLKLDKKMGGKTGDIRIYLSPNHKREIGHIEFYIDEGSGSSKPHICATDVEINEDFQKQGYGRLIIGMLISYANELALPIKLYSIEGAIKFYRKMGFVRDPNENGVCDLIFYPKRCKKPRKKPKRAKPHRRI